MFRKFLYTCLCVWTCFSTGTACASIVMGNTRVIYSEKAKEVTVAIANKSSEPVLVQTWMDEGDASVSPSAAKTPFIVLPPIARVDGEARRALRIRALDTSALPHDRESVFWLNVLDVPTKKTGTDNKNRLQVALQSRIKFFYRPAGLRGSPEKAVNELIWRSTGKGLIASNPSAWNVSLVSVAAGGNIWPVDMVSPGKSREFPTTIKAGTPIKVTWIDDNGASQVADAITQ